MARPVRPTDLYVTNGWYLEMPGLISPHFETLEGVAKTSNSVDLVDGGTNKRHKFSSQILDFGEMNLTRTYQGTIDDRTLYAIVEDMILRGLRLDVMAVKLHHQQEVFRILFEDFRITSSNFPTFDVNAEEKFLVSYAATCSDWNIIN